MKSSCCSPRLFLGYPLPLAAVQILWINIVTEGMLTVNLVMERAEGDEMHRPPISADEPLITRPMLRRMALMVAASVAATFGYFVWRLSTGAPFAVVQSETFTVLAVCQWFNVLNCRSESGSALSLGILKNPWLLGRPGAGQRAAVRRHLHRADEPPLPHRADRAGRLLPHRCGRQPGAVGGGSEEVSRTPASPKRFLNSFSASIASADVAMLCSVPLRPAIEAVAERTFFRGPTWR